MILVTVGTNKQSFNRLLKKIDELKLDDVVMQIGFSTYEPKNHRWFRFTSTKEIQSLYNKADIIIGHGGAGCIIDSVSKHKIFIGVPRLKKFGEHHNNHQLQLLKTLENKGAILTCYDLKNLRNIIKTAKNKKMKKITTFNKSPLITTIKKYIKDQM